VIISNCVINLSADKLRTYQEAYRVLKPGGRLAISDIALNQELPDKVRKSVEAYVGCVGEAVLMDEYKRIVEAAGFKKIKITNKNTSSCIAPNTKDPIGRTILDGLEDHMTLEKCVTSIYVEGYK